MNNIGIRLLVEDFDRAFDFYTEVLGLRANWGSKGDMYASFTIKDEVVLSIYSIGAMEKEMEFFSQTSKRTGDRAVLICAVDDVDKIYKELVNKGVTMLNKPEDMSGWGIRVIYLNDPEGNLLELNSPLPQERWSQGLKEANKKYEY